METQIKSKFRGKQTDNGEWVYGYYYKNESGSYIRTLKDNGKYKNIKIFPETVKKQKNYRKFKIWVKHYPI